jgi:putative hemolysin
VCDGSLDQLRGVISAKVLLKLSLANQLTSLVDEVKPGVFVPESMSGMRLLEHFRHTGEPMVFVVNEYGEILGLVTQQNVLEALAGEFHAPADPQDTWAVQREDGSWLLDGLIPIPELKDRLQLKTVPEEEKAQYNTLSGMMMWLLGNVPKTGAICHWQGWKLEVIDMDGNRLDKVLATWQSLDDGSG